MACVYPDAHSPRELWETILAQRRAFRRMPPERLRMEDYYAADPAAEDRTYLREVALVEDYAFDREHFRVSQETFRSTDLTHWLALDVASRALQDASLDVSGRWRERSAVIVGNSLTGEMSRAAGLRLRWPYVRR